ncbi:hypothetical protein ETD83_37325 [Actinomadura soli]|uniref:XRE family transcriptional regulator n=1 Tax=Actinomadura soli TaxID=2508997 RepID=A0A5C4J187_9ACTN|nr:hypothetical protein [Actinomadura soli]TMQ90010.1 hypothetical protein ETD83_37325 [Actinomadura soli]
MDGAGTLDQIRRLRDRMAGQGATTSQIAATLIAEHDLNPRVAFRHALGLTQAQVADRYNRRWPSMVPKSRKEVSYWECWPGPGNTSSSSSARAPSYEHLCRLAQLYGCWVDDLLFGPRRDHGPAATTIPYQAITDILSNLTASDYAEGPGEDDSVAVTLRAPIGEGSIMVRLSRRQFTELMTASGLAALLPSSVLAEAAAGATSDVASWRQTLAAHQTGHHLLAPHAHITALTTTLADISTARDDAGTELRRQLLQVQAEYAEHIGWLYRECGDLAACGRWAERASKWAQQTGDGALATYMTLRRSTIALHQGDHTRAAQLAHSAHRTDQTGHSIPPALQGIAHLYQARAQAATGTIADRQLDRADELLAAPRQPDDPAFLRFYTPAFGELQRATCYMAAGRPSRAVTILQARLTRLPGIGHRDRALHLARLGAAHAADRAPDAAAIAGLGALTETRRARSLHALTELDRLDSTLSRTWSKQPKVREFHRALQAAASDLERHRT